MLCSEHSSVNENNHEGVVSLLRCKRWSCDLCQDWNRRRVVALARRGQPNCFITLTVNPARYATPDEAAHDLKRGLVLLKRRIAKRYPSKKFSAMCVFERTKAGWPHLHILARAPWIAQKWLSDQMADLIGAPIVDIRKIQDQGRAAKYVSKYVGKDPHVFAHCKRWWRSHDYDQDDGWKPIKVMYGTRWQTVEVSYDEYIARAIMFGAEVEEIRSGFAYFKRRIGPTGVGLEYSFKGAPTEP